MELTWTHTELFTVSCYGAWSISVNRAVFLFWYLPSYLVSSSVQAHCVCSAVCTRAGCPKTRSLPHNKLLSLGGACYQRTINLHTLCTRWRGGWLVWAERAASVQGRVAEVSVRRSDEVGRSTDCSWRLLMQNRLITGLTCRLKTLRVEACNWKLAFLEIWTNHLGKYRLTDCAKVSKDF